MRPVLSPSADEPLPAANLRERRASRVLVLACAFGILFLLSQILMFGHGRDQGIYSVVARTVLEGGMPYRDAWDFKPPGIFFIYAVARALFGNALWGIRVLEVVGLALTSLGMVRLAKRFWGDARLGVVAALINVVVHAQLDFWHTGQPESFGGMLTIAALLCVAPAGPDGDSFLEKPKPGPWLLAGALFGFTFLLKPPLAGGAAAILLLPALFAYRSASEAPLRERWKTTLRAIVKPGLFVAAGAAIPILLCLAWFAARGALRDLYQVLFVFTPHYTALGWKGSTVTGMTYYAFTEWLQQYGSVPTLGVLCALAFGAASKEKPFLYAVIAIIAVHLVGVAMQGKFFPYHYGATWPLTGLLAALGYRGLLRKARSMRRVGLALLVPVFLVAVFGRSATKDTADSFLVRTKKRLAIVAGGLSDQKTKDELSSVADIDTAAIRATADELREKVPADRTIFLWGFEPSMYDIAERRAATRYIYDVPQRVSWAKEEHRRILMDDLRKNPPAAIVLEHWDVIPMVTGDGIDSADTLRDFHDLRKLVEERYELTKKGGKFDIYMERK